MGNVDWLDAVPGFTGYVPIGVALPYIFVETRKIGRLELHQQALNCLSAGQSRTSIPRYQDW